MNIEPVRQKTVVEQVLEQLKLLISTGKYKPGDKFPTEVELAESFGLGRSSIREALKIFQYLGVLENRAPRGNFVARSDNISKEALTWSILLGGDNFYDLMEFRMALEQQGLWYLLVYKSKDMDYRKSIVSKLQNEVDAMARATSDDNFEARLEADYCFHQHLIEGCNNDLFTKIYRTLRIFLKEEMKNNILNNEITPLWAERHQLLIDHINEGNYLATAEAFRFHIANVNDVYDRA